MNLYMCSVELKDDAKALAFARAAENWMGHLKTAGVIRNWPLLRRKLGLGSGEFRDFLLEIEVENLAQLDAAFRTVATRDEDVETLYRAVNTLIGATSIALYRPFPDPKRAERVALI
mgnify:CR=1 FL=1